MQMDYENISATEQTLPPGSAGDGSPEVNKPGGPTDLAPPLDEHHALNNTTQIKQSVHPDGYMGDSEDIDSLELSESDGNSQDLDDNFHESVDNGRESDENGQDSDDRDNGLDSNDYGHDSDDGHDTGASDHRSGEEDHTWDDTDHKSDDNDLEIDDNERESVDNNEDHNITKGPASVGAEEIGKLEAAYVRMWDTISENMNDLKSEWLK